MKNFFRLFYTDLFFGRRFFAGLIASAVLFVASFFLPYLDALPKIFLLATLTITLLDVFALYRKKGILAARLAPEKLSNGDDNPLAILIENRYGFRVYLQVIDEVPFQFQRRDVLFHTRIMPGQKKQIRYELRPVKRGEYEFGDIRVFAATLLKMVSRRYTFGQKKMLPVYPSYLQMKRYELMAVSNRLSDYGIKKIRRVGHSMEFEQIKNYVHGDDHRSINWKATARKGDLMINNFTDEKSQHVYCIIDKSRAMKMPFEGLSLLDYAINASLVVSNVALLKEDRAGLITVAEKIGAMVKADRRPAHINKILEVLYREKTRYLEMNYEALFETVRKQVTQRSLIILFTNFESMDALQRQLPYLKKIARLHLLLVVFFENTELKKLSQQPAHDVEGIYIQTIAEKMMFEKKMIVKELQRYGIQSVLSAPQNLTIDTVNRYLEIKSRQQI